MITVNRFRSFGGRIDTWDKGMLLVSVMERSRRITQKAQQKGEKIGGRCEKGKNEEDYFLKDRGT